MDKVNKFCYLSNYIPFINSITNYLIPPPSIQVNEAYGNGTYRTKLQ